MWLYHFLNTDISCCKYGVYSMFMDMDVDSYKPFTGSVDTNPESWMSLSRPPGKVVLIFRPVDDAVSSMINAFDVPEGFTEEEWTKALFGMMNRYEEILLKIQKTIPVLSLDYKHLESNEVIGQLWDYCFPGYGANFDRINTFQQSIILMKSRSLTPTLKFWAISLKMNYDKLCEKLTKGESLWLSG